MSYVEIEKVEPGSTIVIATNAWQVDSSRPVGKDGGFIELALKSPQYGTAQETARVGTKYWVEDGNWEIKQPE